MVTHTKEKLRKMRKEELVRYLYAILLMLESNKDSDGSAFEDGWYMSRETIIKTLDLQKFYD